MPAAILYFENDKGAGLIWPADIKFIGEPTFAFIPDNSKNKVDMAGSVLDEAETRQDIAKYTTMKAEELRKREPDELRTLERKELAQADTNEQLAKIAKGEKQEKLLKDAKAHRANGKLAGRIRQEVEAEREQLMEHRSNDRKGQLTKREKALRDGVNELMREAGIEVIDDEKEGQRVLDMANGHARLQTSLNGLKKASAFILSSLSGKTMQHGTKLEIPERANRLAEKAVGHPIVSHSIRANELQHINKRHGVNGTVNDKNSIPLRKEDIALMPYIMAAPTRVVRGARATNGTESVRYEKDLSNGTVLVVEREGRFDVEDMENITMWAQKKPATNVTVAQGASHSTSETIVISEADAAKIRKDAEDAVKNDEKVREQRVYHGSANDFDAFDTMNHLSEGEGSQAFGAGTYVADQKDLGVKYANIAYDNNHIKQTEHFNAKRLIKRFPTLESFLNDPKKKEAMARNGKTETEARAYYENQKELAKPPRVLYTVEIPNDNGKNYLDWEGKPSDELRQAAYDKIISLGSSLYVNGSKSHSADEYRARLRKTISSWNNGELYDRMTTWLNSQVAVSEWLNSIGYTGIKVRVAYYSVDSRYRHNYNYVVFNDKDLKITDKVRFFRTSDGQAYGFTVGGKIYIDPRIATSETPIHEYAHLWAEALRKANPKEWQNVVDLMKGCKAVWKQVKKEYPELETDDEIAEEVLAHYSGKRGAEQARKAMEESMDGNDDMKSAAKKGLARLKEALSKFWKNVCDLLHVYFTSAEEVEDKVMYDLLNKGLCGRTARA